MVRQLSPIRCTVSSAGLRRCRIVAPLIGPLVAIDGLHTHVANTIRGLVAPKHGISLGMIIAALIGPIAWNLSLDSAGLGGLEPEAVAPSRTDFEPGVARPFCWSSTATAERGSGRPRRDPWPTRCRACGASRVRRDRQSLRRTARTVMVTAGSRRTRPEGQMMILGTAMTVRAHQCRNNVGTSRWQATALARCSIRCANALLGLAHELPGRHATPTPARTDVTIKPAKNCNYRSPRPSGTTSAALHVARQRSGADLILNEIEPSPPIGSYSLEIPYLGWVRPRGLDTIFGIDTAFERRAQGLVRASGRPRRAGRLGVNLVADDAVSGFASLDHVVEPLAATANAVEWTRRAVSGREPVRVGLGGSVSDPRIPAPPG